MKKVFCILSLALGLLSMIFGMVYIILLTIDVVKKLSEQKDHALEKVKHYVADKLDVVKVEAQDVTEV
ncbi:MAG: hypothetical protein FWB75_08315 [Oscillospiraceae bacterium]|nr:hypothetical protein [Oscillospiraceae bacterium]